MSGLSGITTISGISGATGIAGLSGGMGRSGHPRNLRVSLESPESQEGRTVPRVAIRHIHDAIVVVLDGHWETRTLHACARPTAGPLGPRRGCNTLRPRHKSPACVPAAL